MNVHQEDGLVTLSQCHYMETQLERFNCQDLNSASTPMTKGKATKAEKLENIKSGHNYQSLLGANYLSVTTQPYITFPVSSPSQFLNEPGFKHWDTRIQVLQYLKPKTLVSS